MTIAEIVYRGNGRAGKWRVTPANSTISDDQKDARALFHYSTVMLVWRVADNEIIYKSTGHGSVSDQNGVNTALRVLGGWYNGKGRHTIPVPNTPGPAFYFSRARGAQYIESR